MSKNHFDMKGVHTIQGDYHRVVHLTEEEGELSIRVEEIDTRLGIKTVDFSLSDTEMICRILKNPKTFAEVLVANRKLKNEE